MNIQWYPGHMTAAKRMMLESLKAVDIVIELLDARIPKSSKNPEIDSLAANKFRIIIMNKKDLADDEATYAWSSYYNSKGIRVIPLNSLEKKGFTDITKTAYELMEEKIARQKARGRINVPVRALIAGIPNVGKSTFINRYVGKTVAKTGDKPGVTKGKQWIKIQKNYEILDTPGILWPKFDDRQTGLNLAITGAINDEILDREDISLELIRILMKRYPKSLKSRYNIEFMDEDKPEEILVKIGRSRSFLKKGGDIDTLRTSKILLDELRGGIIGKITLELPED